MTNTKPARSTAEDIFEAIQGMQVREQIVTRETLAEMTGLKQSIIDDRLAHLVDNGRIHRVQRGVFVPAVQHRPALRRWPGPACDGKGMCSWFCLLLIFRHKTAAALIQ